MYHMAIDFCGVKIFMDIVGWSAYPWNFNYINIYVAMYSDKVIIEYASDKI